MNHIVSKLVKALNANIKTIQPHKLTNVGDYLFLPDEIIFILNNYRNMYK